MKPRPRNSSGDPVFDQNQKLRRRSDPLLDAAIQASLERTIRYTGSPCHKSNPGDFDLTPPSAPRLNATLCDKAGITRRATAQELLRSGVADLLISEQFRGGFPTRIWAVRKTDDMVFEARLENESRGEYHGYPLQLSSPFKDEILSIVKGSSGV